MGSLAKDLLSGIELQEEVEVLTEEEIAAFTVAAEEAINTAIAESLEGEDISLDSLREGLLSRIVAMVTDDEDMSEKCDDAKCDCGEDCECDSE